MGRIGRIGKANVRMPQYVRQKYRRSSVVGASKIGDRAMKSRVGLVMKRARFILLGSVDIVVKYNIGVRRT